MVIDLKLRYEVLNESFLLCCDLLITHTHVVNVHRKWLRILELVFF